MNDNYLRAIDNIHRDVEPLTIEGALLVGQEPLKISDLNLARRHVRLLRLAREYLVDFDLVRASARAGIDWELIRSAERDPLFITIVRGLMEEMKPEEVISRSEVLLMLKREAMTAGKSADRINAMNHLARLAGMELGDPSKDKGGAPTINITLNTGSPDERPMINVTTSVKPEALL